MGNDGGSIPKRRELVKEAARQPTSAERKATALEFQTHFWSTCPISSLPLDPHNTVSDFRGRLYNYETILRCLLPNTTSPSPDPAHQEEEEKQSQEAIAFADSKIHSLKDIVKLRFNLRKDTRSNTSSKHDPSELDVRTCPLSMKELGPTTRSVYIVPCGHVFAEIAVKELLAAEEPADDSAADPQSQKQRNCPQCSEPFLDRDIIPILPVDEADLDRCAKRIEDLRTLGLAHNLKKDKSAGGKKKNKRKAAEEEDGGKLHEHDGTTNGADGNGTAQKEKKQKRDRGDISSRINNAMTATVTAKVLAEQEERNKQRKLAAAVR